jgi:hypothetical protein
MTGTEPNPHPDAVDFESAGTEERPLPPPSVLESVITELLGAVPEVRDHVLEAADALLDAAKALIDAADRVVRQQRRRRRDRGRRRRSGSTSAGRTCGSFVDPDGTIVEQRSADASTPSTASSTASPTRCVRSRRCGPTLALVGAAGWSTTTVSSTTRPTCPAF